MENENKVEMEKEIAAFQLRIPTSMNKQLEAEAAANKRTKNGQIEWILDQHLKQLSAMQPAQAN